MYLAHNTGKITQHDNRKGSWAWPCIFLPEAEMRGVIKKQ